MTVDEKMNMFKEKKAFIDNISKVFEAKPVGSSVESIKYEVYKKLINREEGAITYFTEYLVVTFVGGEKAVRIANGNSNIANFQELGKMIECGYFDEVLDYDALSDCGFEEVSFEEKNLEQLLKKPLTHITDVLECFEYCKDEFDVAKVIRAIPSGFGTFYADFNEDETGFTITNEYTDVDDSFLSETYDFDFYTGGLN
jgi:hypothetical protein